MKNDFTLAFNEIMDSRALTREVVLEAIEQALVSAYKRDANITTKQKIEANIDDDGQPHIYIEKEVVDDIISEQTEVTLTEARDFVGNEVELGEMVMMPATNTSSNFGRIAAQTAKQVILQRIREAERESLYDEFIERQGDLITGTVQSVSNKLVTLSLGRAEAIMPRQHQIPNERYRQHDKIRTYVVEVNKSSRGPQIIVSRAHKDMLRRLLEYEVPEIYNGQVEIKNIAREAGQRSKVAVTALQDGIDPVGACVGMRGMRIQNIIKELNNEKIDVIEWDVDQKKFIAKALSPARVSSVFLYEDIDQPRTATVIVPDDQLSLAIGKEGQNARLAAKLTGWRIDIKSVTESALDNHDMLQTSLADLPETDPEFFTEVARIVDKKHNNRPIMPEEFNTLTRFVERTEAAKLELKRDKRDERKAKLDEVRDLVPENAFELPIESLELADDINRALGRSINNVGELMVRIISDEHNLSKMLTDNRAGEDAMEAIRYALDDLVIPELTKADHAEAEAESVEESEVETAIDDADETEVVGEAEKPLAEESEDIHADDSDDIEAEEVPELPDDVQYAAADGEDEGDEFDDGLTPEMWPDEEELVDSRRAKKASKSKRSKDVEEEWEDYPDDYSDDKPSKKKGKRRKVHLVYDEDMGEVVAKRRRKGNRRRKDIDNFDDFDF
jgi:N utilization substance protein A